MMGAGMALASRFRSPFAAFSQVSAGSSAEHRLPVTDFNYKAVRSYIEDEPVPEYRWASDIAYEAFRDMKYGIRIHWGLYSVAGFTGESWRLLEINYQQRARYNEMYRKWNPSGFDADTWASLFAESGFRMLAFTTKHHEFAGMVPYTRNWRIATSLTPSWRRRSSETSSRSCVKLAARVACGSRSIFLIPTGMTQISGRMLTIRSLCFRPRNSIRNGTLSRAVQEELLGWHPIHRRSRWRE